MTYEVIGYFSAPGYFTVNSNGGINLLSSLANDTALSYTVSTRVDQASKKDERWNLFSFLLFFYHMIFETKQISLKYLTHYLN